MRVGDFQTSAARLQEALDELLRAWGATTPQWHDDNARSFEEIHLQRIRDEVAIALPAIAQLTHTVRQAVRDCEE